jgi:hypothetical protein
MLERILVFNFVRKHLIIKAFLTEICLKDVCQKCLKSHFCMPKTFSLKILLENSFTITCF